MKYVLTLIGNKETPLSQAFVETARDPLPAPTAPDWLADDLACDIAFEVSNPEQVKELENEVRRFLTGFGKLTDGGIDAAIQPAENRRKKLLVADMDSTIIGQECIDELADELGLKPQIAAITERAMKGEIEFEPALRERVALLKGLDIAALEKVYRARITETPGGRVLTATMRAHGAACALVSGGFSFFTSRVAAAVGFDINQANELLFENEKLTGAVQEPILGRQAKIDALVRLRGEMKLSNHETMAVGDGANDLGMIGEAGLGVAFHAKPVVAEAADARVDHGDLTALLYLQGYRQTDIRQD